MVSIKQIAPEQGAKLMGLENIGLNLFPGVSRNFEIPLKNNKPYIGQDKPQYKAKIQKFEEFFNTKFDSIEGQDFLNNFEIEISHDITAYDPNDTRAEFILHVLDIHGGMGEIATSDVAIENVAINTFKFKLTDDARELDQKINKKETKMAAIRKLSELYDTNTERLILIAKYMFSANSGIGTNKKLALDKLSDYIEESTDKANQFLKVVQMEPQHMDTTVSVKDGIHRGLIRKGNDNQYTLISNGTKLGRTEEEVVNFFSDSQNADLLGWGLDDDYPYSLKAQLKNQ